MIVLLPYTTALPPLMHYAPPLLARASATMEARRGPGAAKARAKGHSVPGAAAVLESQRLRPGSTIRCVSTGHRIGR
eukprot:619046-Rhodomonas_salina.8